jgi:hypothetical protein
LSECADRTAEQQEQRWRQSLQRLSNDLASDHPHLISTIDSYSFHSNCGLGLSSSATASILRGAPLGGEIERAFFAFFTLVSRKRAKIQMARRKLTVVYTTDVIESLNFSLRKIIKGRSAFSNDDSVYRLIVSLRQNGVGASKNLCRRHSAEGSRLTGLISDIRETPISYYVGLRT